MSANIGQIVAEITANTAGLKKGESEAAEIVKKINNKKAKIEISAEAGIFNTITNNLKGLKTSMSELEKKASLPADVIKLAYGTVAAYGVIKLINVFEICTDTAIENKKALMGLESVAKAYGVSVDDATKATKDFTQDGLIQMKNATTGMKNILSTGFSISEAMNLSQALKDIGAFNNVVVGGLGVAFEDVTKGMRTGSIELIENIGLTQRLSSVMKQAQKQAQASGDTERARQLDISNGIDLTNNAAQREAFYNMVLKEGEKFKGNAAKLANDQASSQAKANAAMKEAADAIGNRLLPVYSDLMDVITSLAKETAEMFKVTEFSRVSSEIESQKTKLNELSHIYLELKDKTDKSNVEQKIFLDTMEELKAKYPDFLGKIDLQNIKTSSAITLLDELNNQLERKYINMMAEAELGDKYKELVKRKSEELQIQKNILAIEAKRAARAEGKAPKIGVMDLVGEQRWYDTYKEALSATRKNIEKLKIEIADTKDKWNNLIYDMDTKGKKTTAYTKPDFLVKAEKDTKEAQRIQAELDKKNAEGSGTGAKKSKKETFSLDVSETTKQKLIEQEYKYKTDLANAKEEEKWRVELENKKAVAIIKATAEAEEKIAAIRKKVEKSELSEKAGRSQAVAINEQLASDIGIFELSEATAKSKAEKAYEKFGKALGLLDINNYIDSENLKLEVEVEVVVPDSRKGFKNYSARDKLFGYKEGHFNPAVGLTDMSNYGVPAITVEPKGGAKEEAEYVNKTLNDVTKSFSELAAVLDNEVISAISNVANAAVSMNSSIKGFSAAQGAGDKLGMLSSGIGIFSSAVSIFQSVGGLFHKSTYNFDEAVKKMLAGIGEKTPNIQVAQYEKGIKLKTDIAALNLGVGKEGYDALNNYLNSINVSWKEFYETMAVLDKIIPQLAEQLGTAAADFGSAIGSALSSSATSEELKANLYDSIYGTVKSGLINAFLAGEVMKPLLNQLQETVTLAVASGGIDGAEKEAIQKLFGEVGIKTDEFYSALEAVGLNVVDAAGQLNKAADRMDNVNRNLRLADRISTITTQTSTAGITQLAGNSSIVYDFSNANLGGMTEQQVISAVSKANRMASIRKVGV